jgi:glycosyltransferase involved in cell wall biosynthesis
MGYPKISVVTPSFNQADYLERTIRSVLNQGYPNLEYIIIDGGSTDGSVEIIKRYASRLAYWVSEPDRGQSHAINKGLQRATGEWVGWQNSDDLYLPGSFARVAEAARKNPQAGLIIGDMQLITADDGIIRELRYVRPTYQALLAEGMVLTNQAAFWRRDLHTRIGWLDESLHYGFDYEWFLRVLQTGCRAEHIPEILGALRYHADTKTSRHQHLFNAEYQNILLGRVLPPWKKNLYRFRRLLLTLADGHYRYVLRGVGQRLLTKKRGHGSFDGSAE